MGYVYQFRYGLYVALKKYQQGMDWDICFESVDDLSSSTPKQELSQLKLRAPATRLTDASTDLWKTLRIWSSLANARQLDLTNCNLFLVSTAAAPEGSAARALRPGPDRDIEKACSVLVDIATSSKNKTLEKAFAEFLALGEELQREVLRAVEVLDESPDLQQVEKELAGLASIAVG